MYCKSEEWSRDSIEIGHYLDPDTKAKESEINEGNNKFCCITKKQDQYRGRYYAWSKCIKAGLAGEMQFKLKCRFSNKEQQELLRIIPEVPSADDRGYLKAARLAHQHWSTQTGLAGLQWNWIIPGKQILDSVE